MSSTEICADFYPVADHLALGDSAGGFKKAPTIGSGGSQGCQFQGQAGAVGDPGDHPSAAGNFNLKEKTLVISNSSTCTLKLQSSLQPRNVFMNKNKKSSSSSKKDSTYTVQFNKETTKTTKTTSSEVCTMYI